MQSEIKGMLRPDSEAELGRLVAEATGAFVVTGGGTRAYGRPCSGVPLSMAGMSGLTLYEPGALTMVARAGTSLAEVEAALAAERQRLPFEPVDLRGLLGTTGTPTIGGVFATNASGPRRVEVGAARDFLLGVRFVDGLGRIVKNGGRVMKNVTGYDLVKLMAGSHGTLGVLTEVSFKVLPCPEASATLAVHDLSPDRAVAAMSAALGSPFEVSGAAWHRGVVWLRIEGFAASVAYRADRLARELAPFGGVVQDHSDGVPLWQGLRDVAPFHHRPGDVWRISVRPSAAPGIINRIAARDILMDWGGGLIWALTDPGTDLRARISPFSGHATLIRAGADTRAALPTFQPEPPAVAVLTAGLRAQFDPRGLFNPGKMT